MRYPCRWGGGSDVLGQRKNQGLTSCCVCHTDSGGTSAGCGILLRQDCVYVPCHVCKGGRRPGPKKINGTVFGYIPGEHPHQSNASRRSLRCRMHAPMCLRQERLRVVKHFLIIQTQFLRFLLVRILLCKSSLYKRCCVYFPQVKVVFGVTSQQGL